MLNRGVQKELDFKYTSKKIIKKETFKWSLKKFTFKINRIIKELRLAWNVYNKSVQSSVKAYHFWLNLYCYQDNKEYQRLISIQTEH